MAFIRVVNKPLDGGPVEIIKGGTIQSGYDQWVTPNLSAYGVTGYRTGNNVSSYTGSGYGAVATAYADRDVSLYARCLIYFTAKAVGRKCTVTWSANASARYGTFQVYAYATGYGYALNYRDVWPAEGRGGTMEFTIPASGYIDLYAKFEGNSASWGPAVNATIGSLIIS